VRAVTLHKFKVGSRVGLVPGNTRAALGEYKIVRQLPAEDNVLQYRIKSEREPNERLVKEYQLHPWQI
jgi:hypothetical protein